MLVHEQDDSARLTGSSGGMIDRWLGGFAWCEAFILAGLHCFWVLSKSSPLGVDNVLGPFLALAPFVIMAAIGLGTLNARFRAALVGIESALHLAACVLLCALLFYVVLHDPFEPFLPLATPMALWSVALSVVLAADLACHLRVSAAERASISSSWRTILFAVVWWAVTMWLASGAAWVVYFWTASIVMHAILAPGSLRRTSMPTNSAGVPTTVDRFKTTIEAFLLVSLFLLIQVRAVYGNAYMGPLEEKYLVYLDVYRTPVFAAGAALFLVAAWLRATLPVHAAVIALLLLSDEALSWPLAIGLGYGLLALFNATRRLGGLGYAVSCLFMMPIWVLGLSAFAFGGLIVHFDRGIDVVRMIIRWDQYALVVLFILWLFAAVFAWWRRGPDTCETEAAVSPAPGIGTRLVVFCVILVAAAIPGLFLLANTAWPPRVMERPARVTVDKPMAVCHAGYDQNDEEYDSLHKLGVQAIRADFHWSRIQPDPNTWNFEYRDGYVDAAVSHGVRVIALLDFDNDGVEQDPVGKTRKVYVAPSDIPRFLEYVRKTVAHYKGRVYAWEIWNEPNIDIFWQGTLDEFYVLARQTAEAVRSVDESARIVGTAMTSPMGTLLSSGIDGLHATGSLTGVQHPSGHLYVPDPRNYYLEFMRLIGAASRFNHPGPVWVTELGAPDGGFYAWTSGTDRLAEHVIKAYTIGTSLGIDMIVWYAYRDANAEHQARLPRDSERFFGLLGPDGQWKPSAHAYSLFSRLCSDSEIRNDLIHVVGGLAARQVRSALYRREDGESALVLWFEPMLRPWGKARVRIDLGGTPEPPIVHDIASDYSKPLFDDHVLLSEKPVVISFKVPDMARTVRIEATSSPVDALWLLILAGMTIGSLVVCLRARNVVLGRG